MRVRFLISALAVLLSVMPAWADGWLATKVMGRVEQQVGDFWQPVATGEAIENDRLVRSAEGARAEFQRGAEFLRMGANTQIRIHDKTGEKFTDIDQAYGTLEVEAEVRNVQHLAVRTPFLVAVVKGTRFTVRATALQSSVDVERGLVAVEAISNGHNAAVAAGQRVTFVRDGDLEISGAGQLPPILGRDGAPIELALAGEAEQGAASLRTLAESASPTHRAATPSLDLAPRSDEPVPVTLQVGKRDENAYKAPGWISSEFGLVQALLLVCGGLLIGAVALILRRVF